MKRYLSFLIITTLILSLNACKNKKDNEVTNPGAYDPNNTVTPDWGDGFVFWGDGKMQGGQVQVTPAELLRLQIKFNQDFLNVIAELQHFIPQSINIELRSSADSTKIMSKPHAAQGVSALDPTIMEYILNHGAGDYYLAACAGGFGDVHCSGANLLQYEGEDGSYMIPSAPRDIYGEDGCRFFNFNLDIKDPYNDLFNPSLHPFYSMLSQVEIYRNRTDFSSPQEAIEIIDPYSVGISCSYQYCRFNVQLSSWYTDGYIAVRVRDFDGKLSPISHTHKCVE